MKKINLGLHVWVTSAATSEFHIFKIRTSTDPHFNAGRFNDIIRGPEKLRIIKIPGNDYQGRSITMSCCKNLEWCSEKFDAVGLFVWRTVHQTYVYWMVIRRIQPNQYSFKTNNVQRLI